MYAFKLCILKLSQVSHKLIRASPPPPCRPRCLNKEVQVGKKRDGGAEKGHATDHYAGWEDLPHQNIVEISQVSLNSF